MYFGNINLGGEKKTGQPRNSPQKELSTEIPER